MILIDLYKSILKTANLVTGPDGFVSVTVPKDGELKTEPWIIEGKRVALPTSEQLANPNWKERIVFHPLSENILHVESKILEAFRTKLNQRLNYTFGVLALELLQIATSESVHGLLSPDQASFLSKLKNADEKTMKLLIKLLGAMGGDKPQNAFVSIFLKKPGTVHDKPFKRVGVVAFPFYKELVKKGATECYDIKMSEKDRKSLIALMEYMMPGLDEPEAYNRGTNSDVAPFLDALMAAVLAVAGPLNDIVELFSNMLATNSARSKPEYLKFEGDWVETFENLAVMLPQIRMVPVQGAIEAMTPKQAMAPTVSAPIGQAPAQQMQLAPQQQQFQQPPQFQQTQQPYQQPNYQQQQQPQQPQIVRTANGLDFNSIVQSNPALQQQIGMGMQGNFQQFNQQQPRQPKWTRPDPQQFQQQGYPNQQFQQPQQFNQFNHPQQQQQFNQFQQPQFPNRGF